MPAGAGMKQMVCHTGASGFWIVDRGRAVSPRGGLQHVVDECLAPVQFTSPARNYAGADAHGDQAAQEQSHHESALFSALAFGVAVPAPESGFGVR